MTNFVTSTEPPAAGGGAPGWRRHAVPAVLGGLTLGFAVLLLALNRFRPTLAGGFLLLGWVSILATAWLVWRAVVAFDLSPASELEGTSALSDRRRLDLEREKKVLLKAIKEIEFDAAMGKIEDAEAAAITARYRARALEIIRDLDVRPKDYGAVIEEELARRMKKEGPLRPAESVWRSDCPKCKTHNDPDAQFCKKCGGRLDAEGES